MRGSAWFRISVPIFLLLLTCCASSGLRKVSLRVSSPYFPGVYETHDVKPRQDFPVMDLDLHARVTEFIADFAIDTTAKRVFSASDTLRNPAVKVEIYKGDSLVESSWAFPVGTFKHVSRRTSLIFEILHYVVGKPYVALPEIKEERPAGAPGGKS